MGTSRNAKRATCIHLLFNVIGTVIFTAVVLVFPVTALIEAAVPSPKAQIAAMHMIFNLATTILLLPLGNWLARLAEQLLPDREEPQSAGTEMRLAYLTPVTGGGKDGGLGVSAIVVDQLRNELHRMLEMARQNVEAGFNAVLRQDTAPLERVEQREEYIDFLNREISRYVSRLIAIETNERGSRIVSSFFTISGNIERISDHADNLAGYTRLLVEKGISFSVYAQEEIRQMRDISIRAVTALLSGEGGRVEWLSQVAQLEQRIDDMTADFRRDQLSRMREGACSDEACILYSELLTDFERIGDHVLNIAEELTKARTTL
jgi:phosphate:Na+ symporter